MRQLTSLLIAALMMFIMAQAALAADWPMFRHDLNHTGTSEEVAAPPLDLLWKYTTGAGWGIGSSPAVSGGVVYVGSIDGNVYAFTAHKVPVQATVDFDPDTLNLKSKDKWVTTYIELPEGYDVSNIDVSTVMLNDQVEAESTPTEVGDYDDDGIADLMVKFDRSAVQKILKIGEKVDITITGELTDESLFEGSDAIRVIDKGKGK